MTYKIKSKEISGKAQIVTIDRCPDECPICYTSLNFKLIAASYHHRAPRVQVVFRCMKSACSALFIATYHKGSDGLFELRDVAPISPKPQQHSSLIQGISQMFQSFYAEAVAAEASGLPQLSGIGFYKALDFLIREFLIDEHSEHEPQLRASTLSGCIENFIDDANIKNCAKAARCFSDRHAFHTIKWESKDIENIKLLIRLTVNWIESTVLAKQFAKTTEDFKITHPPISQESETEPESEPIRTEPEVAVFDEDREEIVKEIEITDMEGTDIVSLISKFSISHSLDAKDVRDLISFLEIRKYNNGDFIVKKGDQGRNLYIILSGKAEVVGEDGLHIAILDRGEILGEMSLISGTPITATVRAIEPVEMLCLNARDFGKVLKRFPSVQMFFAKLLADRLMKTNKARSEDFSLGMAGKLSEMPPSELFQVFNVNQKTGVLGLNLMNGRAEVAFRDGQMIRVSFGEKEGVEAFFELLKEKEGRFKFLPGLSDTEMKLPRIGDFMWLLMEGMRKIDENSRKE